jgi:hypothetical protein
MPGRDGHAQKSLSANPVALAWTAAHTGIRRHLRGHPEPGRDARYCSPPDSRDLSERSGPRDGGAHSDRASLRCVPVPNVGPR